MIWKEFNQDILSYFGLVKILLLVGCRKTENSSLQRQKDTRLKVKYKETRTNLKNLD